MSDIIRNSDESNKTKQTTKKPIKLDSPKENKKDIQLHFGNLEIVKIKLLEVNSKNQVTIIKLLNEIKNLLDKK